MSNVAYPPDPVTAAPGDPQRPVIAASWHRARLAGVDPAEISVSAGIREIDSGSSLMTAARPVLETLDDELSGSGYSTMLADRECRLVRRWFDDARTHDGFDELDLVEGISLLEDSIGTNGLGTVFETRAPVIINGREHFVAALRRFSCYGHPIRHPLTRRIEGVLDVSALLETASPLIPPLIARAVADIEQRLLGSSRSSETHLLTAFQEASGLRRRALLAIGDDIVMVNQAASGLLSASDLALLQVLAREPLRRAETSLELTLESGQSVRVTLTRVPGAKIGALLRIDAHQAPVGRRGAEIAGQRRAAPARPVTVLVSGPPGTGRTTRAMARATEPVTVMRGSDAIVDGPEEWARGLATAFGAGRGTVVVDGLDLLSPALVDLLLRATDTDSRPDLVLVSGPVAGLTGTAAELAATADSCEETVPLAARPDEIPEIANRMLRDLGCSADLHLSPAVVRLLAEHSWPGNLRELRAVLAHAAARRTSGGLVVDDLPDQYRSSAPGASLDALARAERDVIVAALRRSDGNKVRAAKELGLSRTTLYARIRQLRITGY